MNRIFARSSLLMIISFIHTPDGFSQLKIASYPLSVSFEKTTNLIFPYRIQKADIGSGNVIGHQDPALDNVLFVKANHRGFNQTNLSVYTADGKFYSFLVRYAESPDTLNLSFIHQPGDVKIVDSFNQAELDSDGTQIMHQPGFLHQVNASEEMKAVLKGIYIKHQTLWFEMEISNRSQIDYHPESIQFLIRDRHVAKRTANQETEVTPIWVSPNKNIPGHTTGTVAFGFTAFSLAPEKELLIHISEVNGGRSMTVKLKPKTLLRARLLL